MKKQKLPVVLFLIIGLVSCLAFTVYMLKERALLSNKAATTLTTTIQPSPTPGLNAHTVIEKIGDGKWSKYTNEKIGVSFEYPNYFQIEELEIDNKGKYENSPYPEYGYSIDFSTQESRGLKPYPLDEMGFDMSTAGIPGKTEFTYMSERTATFVKKIGNYEWQRYAPYDCSNKPKDGIICFDNWGGWYLSYEVTKGGFDYSFTLQNESLENSPEFLRMIETTVISPPLFETP